jgi:hypothetical protein
MDQIIREAIEIRLHANIMNKEDGFSLSRSRKTLYSHPEGTEACYLQGKSIHYFHLAFLCLWSLISCTL